MKQQRFLCVYASNLAACVGMNKYKPPHEALEDAWRRIDGEGYRAAFERNPDVVTREETVRRALDDNAALAEAVGAATTAKNSSSTAAVGTAADAMVAIDAAVKDMSLPPETARLVKEHAQSRVFTRFGTSREDAVYRELADTMGMDIRKHAAFHKRKMGETPGGEPWFIGGKVDAVTADRSRVVEIKNRVRRLFGTVVEYERVQLQTYMQLLDIRHATLAECLTPKEDEMKINVIHVDRDQDFWDREVMPRLERFVSLLADVLDDPDVQDEYVGDREACIHRRVLAAVP